MINVMVISPCRGQEVTRSARAKDKGIITRDNDIDRLVKTILLALTILLKTLVKHPRDLALVPAILEIIWNLKKLRIFKDSLITKKKDKDADKKDDAPSSSPHSQSRAIGSSKKKKEWSET